MKIEQLLNDPTDDVRRLQPNTELSLGIFFELYRADLGEGKSGRQLFECPESPELRYKDRTRGVTTSHFVVKTLYRESHPERYRYAENNDGTQSDVLLDGPDTEEILTALGEVPLPEIEDLLSGIERMLAEIPDSEEIDLQSFIDGSLTYFRTFCAPRR